MVFHWHLCNKKGYTSLADMSVLSGSRYLKSKIHLILEQNTKETKQDICIVKLNISRSVNKN